MFACLAHWRMVPAWLQHQLWAVYVPGQETTKQVTRLYLLVQARCRIAIAQREGRDIAGPMAEIRRLAASSQARALHEAIDGRSDAEALTQLDRGLPKLVAAYKRRDEARA